MKKINFSAIFIFVFVLGLAALAGESRAQAHRLNVFAWLKGDQVVVECNFGENRPAKNARVSILDASDNNRELLNGQTDNQGIYTFTVPQVVRQGHGLAIDVNAGQGHHNVWHMDASELYEAASLTAGFEEAAIAEKAQEKARAAEKKTPAGENGQPSEKMAEAPQLPVASAPQSSVVTPETVPMPESKTYATPDHVRAIVREEMENGLSSIRRHMAQASSQGPGFTEIVGGLGWIVGIVGIALWLRSRRGRETS